MIKPSETYIPFLTRSDLMGTKKELNELEEIIKADSSINNLLPILSQLASIPSNVKNYEIFKNDYKKHLLTSLTQNKVDSKDAERLINQVFSERSIFSRQGCLFLFKMILALGKDQFDITIDSIVKNYIRTFLFITAISDHIYEPRKDPLSTLFQSFLFYNNSSFAVELGRTLLLYTHFAKDPQLSKSPDFIDVNKVFQENFGCSIETYIVIIFGIYAIYHSKIPEMYKITPDWFQSITRTFSLTNISEIAKAILQPLTFTMEEAKQNFGSLYKDPWDFRFFSERPLFKISEDIFFPVSLSFLEHSLTEGLFWKIRSCYPEKDSSFHNFFGKPFELYVRTIVKESSRKSPLPYEVIDEFSYSHPEKKSETKSPDIMIRLDTKLIAIESKAQKLNFANSVVLGDLESIEKDRIKMTIKPMEQLYSRVNELMNGASDKVNFSDIDEVYLIVVNQGAFPSLKPLKPMRIKTEEEWLKLEGIKTTPHFFIMSIEELELFASVLERRRPVFRLLNHKRNFPDESFKEFICKQFTHLRFPQMLMNTAKQISETSKIIFTK